MEDWTNEAIKDPKDKLTINPNVKALVRFFNYCCPG